MVHPVIQCILIILHPVIRCTFYYGKPFIPSIIFGFIIKCMVYKAFCFFQIYALYRIMLDQTVVQHNNDIQTKHNLYMLQGHSKSYSNVVLNYSCQFFSIFLQTGLECVDLLKRNRKQMCFQLFENTTVKNKVTALYC